MKMKHINYILVVMILLLPIVSASGSIWTGALSPSSANMCGQYSNNITVTATNIWNREEVNLTDVKATLIIPSGSGLTFFTNQTVFLGNVTALSKSTVDSSWTIKCNPSYSDNYTLYVNYTTFNGYSGSSIDLVTSRITVYSAYDGTPPVVTNHSPNATVLATYTTLTLVTDEASTCKYSTTSSVGYDSMSEIFGTTGGAVHKEPLSGLTDKTYHYYIKCKDDTGNKATDDYDAEFDVDAPPTAEITLSDSLPLRAGTTIVTLKTSEDVQPTPALMYSSDGSSFTNINLSGSGSTWTGYMIITS